MKITIERPTLADALSAIAGVVPRKSTVAILGHVMIDANSDGRVTLRGTNLDMDAAATVEASVAKAGKTTVPAGMLLDIARNAPEGAEIVISADKGSPRATVHYGRSRFNLPIAPAEDFPIMQPDSWTAEIQINGIVLAELLSRVAYASARDMSSSSFMGVRIIGTATALQAVAMDGKRLASATVSIENGSDFALTLPPSSAAEMAKMAEGESIVTLSASDVRVGLAAKNMEFLSKVIDYPYADFAPLIERISAFSNTLTVGREEIIAAVRRVRVADANTIKLSVGEAGLSVSSRSVDADAEDVIAAEISGDASVLGFDATYLLECLSMLRGDTVVFTYKDKDSPRLLRSGDDCGAFGMIGAKVV